MGEVFVINLADRLDRRLSAAATLDACGVPYRFVDAWDGRKEPVPWAYDRSRRLRLAAKDLTPGEIGCYMSHIIAMRLMLSAGMDWAVIAEDDLVADPDLGNVISALSAMHERLEIVKLESSEERKRRFRQIAPLSSGRELVRVSNVVHGAAGYFITRLAAEKFIRHSRRFFRPVDVAMVRSWETGIDVLAVHPWPIRQDKTIPGSIEAVRFSPLPVQLNFNGASRWLNRQWDSVAKRAAYLGAIPHDLAFGREPVDVMSSGVALDFEGAGGAQRVARF